MSGFSLQDGKVKAASKGEAQGVVDADGGVIFREYVQEGRLAATEDGVSHCGEKLIGVPTAARIGMGADCTNLNELREMEALTGHGDEPVFVEDAPESAEFHGALTKGTWLRECGEFEHGRDVGGGEAPEGGFGRKRIRLGSAGGEENHLVNPTAARRGPACGRLDRAFEKDDYHFVRLKEPAKRIIAFSCLVTSGTQGANLG